AGNNVNLGAAQTTREVDEAHQFKGSDTRKFSVWNEWRRLVRRPLSEMARHRQICHVEMEIPSLS
ncbi:hypothetical protein Q3O98_12940, partial [Ralstonia pseudosolanacearum]|nr:hypothetical protein [Ralstonia pseudosolanacearum]